MPRRRCPHCRRPLDSMSYKIPRTKRKESAQNDRPMSDIRPIIPYRGHWRQRWRDEFGM